MTTNLPYYPLTNTGCNDANKVNANFAGLDTAIGARSVCIGVATTDTSLTVGDGKVMFLVPATLNSSVLTGAIAGVYDKGVTGTTTVQLRRRRGISNVDMLSTGITIGDDTDSSNGVINTANDDIATGDRIMVDIDTVHSGTAPRGLSVTLTFSGA